ncbi:MAG: lycopene cyclase domain-containing protein [Cyclobacteriaceae bacterium]
MKHHQVSALYLVLNLLTISFPLVRSFEPRVNYSSRWKALFPALFITATFFLVWDVIFTRNGVWGFNPDYLVGISLLSLPIEEWMFFFTVPFASVFIYDCIHVFFNKISTNNATRVATLILGLMLIVLALANQSKSYTFWNFSFAGIYLILIGVLNPVWLGKFWLAYIIHLIPFILVNGILTGSFLESPIVWYNNLQNLAIRIFSIPIEDTIYALLLLLMNVSIYEMLNKRFQLRT